MTEIRYTLIRKKGFSAGASIRISAEKGVVVRAPFWMPKGMIENFIQEKTDWIEKNIKRLSHKIVDKKYVDGEKHLFFGKEYTLCVNPTSNPGRCKVNLIEEKIEVQIHDQIPKSKHPEKIKEALLYWYLEMGIEVITEKVNYFSKAMGVDYQKIDLKKVNSIWGSCSPGNCLSFNRKLVMAPHEVVDYVVIHEVAHMVHRNHGSGFWNLVASFDPGYKKHRQWLKLNHHLLAI